VNRRIPWAADLLLGCRLTLSGGRPAWFRLALTAVGIGLAVCVLLLAASAPTTVAHRDARSDGLTELNTPVAGVDALVVVTDRTDFRGEGVRAGYLTPTGPHTPVPPGLDRVPKVGEAVVSPALATLLASSDGQLLRPRIPGRIVGTVAESGLVAPNDLVFYTGAQDLPRSSMNLVYGYGRPQPINEMPAELWLLVVVGVIVLLAPVLMFAAISTRLSGAERDRKLSALRLIGAGAQRVRRIASGEALLGALAGLVTGAVFFLVIRQFAEDVELSGIRVFVDDVEPSPVPAVLIAVLVPVVAVVTALGALRRTIIEPLGVVRHTTPVRRRLWWRLVPVVAGAVLLATQPGDGHSSSLGGPVVAAGIVLLLFGVPMLLPWLVEKAVGRLRGGPPSWQLATRRLQLDGGITAKVVGGVAVLLAGGIALQCMMIGVERNVGADSIPRADQNALQVSMSEGAMDSFAAAGDLVRKSPGVRAAEGSQSVAYRSGDSWDSFRVLSCDAMRSRVQLGKCADGDVFWAVDAPSSQGSPTEPSVRAGQVLTLTAPVDGGASRSKDGPKWTVPGITDVTPLPGVNSTWGLLVTPGALAGVGQVPYSNAELVVRLDPGNPDAAELVRNSLAPLSWKTSSYYLGAQDLTKEVKQYQAIRRGLVAGSLITLLLAGASLVMLALEQVRERRRPLAVLAATGVRRGVLARSLLWQNAIPLLVATLVAVVVGIGLGALLLRLLSRSLVFDWSGIVILAASAVVLVFGVTVLTLPSLREATAAPGLRAE
jgi:hypothetical protein